MSSPKVILLPVQTSSTKQNEGLKVFNVKGTFSHSFCNAGCPPAVHIQESEDYGRPGLFGRSGWVCGPYPGIWQFYQMATSVSLLPSQKRPSHTEKALCEEGFCKVKTGCKPQLRKVTCLWKYQVQNNCLATVSCSNKLHNINELCELCFQRWFAAIIECSYYVFKMILIVKLY